MARYDYLGAALILLWMARRFNRLEKLSMDEKSELDLIKSTITDTVAPYIAKLQANQKDPNDAADAAARQAEELEIANALKALVPSS